MSVRQHLKSPVANLQWLPCFCGNCMLPRHAFQLSVCLEMLWSRQDAGSGDIIQSCQGFVFIPFRLLFPKQWSPRLLGFWHNFSENIQYYYIRSTYWFICTVDWVWQVTIHWWTSALRIMTSLPSPHPAVPGASPCRCGNSEPPPGPEYSKLCEPCISSSAWEPVGRAELKPWTDLLSWNAHVNAPRWSVRPQRVTESPL